jgi:hypothetical protein
MSIFISIHEACDAIQAQRKNKNESHFTARRSGQRKSDIQQRSGLRKQLTGLKA